jgi:ubiquinone/menaquinone biosynthesis C-methylase UbiE
MTLNNLDSFPQLYHIHHQNAMDDLPFWQQLVRQYPQIILELGCGTGRLTLNLANSANRIIGLDRDPTMLRFLRSQIETQSLQPIELVQANFSAFHFDCNFSLIFLACNTFSTLPQQVRLKLLRNVQRHLSTHGVFSASIPNPQSLKRLPAHSSAEIDEVLIHPETGNPLQISSEWQRQGTIFTVSWYYDQLFPNGTVERITYHVKHHLQSSEDYLREITLSGLSICEVYGDFDGQRYQKDSPYLIFIAGLTDG